MAPAYEVAGEKSARGVRARAQRSYPGAPIGPYVDRAAGRYRRVGARAAGRHAAGARDVGAEQRLRPDRGIASGRNANEVGMIDIERRFRWVAGWVRIEDRMIYSWSAFRTRRLLVEYAMDPEHWDYAHPGDFAVVFRVSTKPTRRAVYVVPGGDDNWAPTCCFTLREAHEEDSRGSQEGHVRILYIDGRGQFQRVQTPPHACPQCKGTGLFYPEVTNARYRFPKRMGS